MLVTAISDCLEFTFDSSGNCGNLLEADCATLNCGEILKSQTSPSIYEARYLAMLEVQTPLGLQRAG